MVSADEHGKVWIAKPKIEGKLIDYMSQMKPEETVTVSIWAIYVSPEAELQQIPSKYPDVPFVGYYPALGANVSPDVLDAIEADITEIKLRANNEAVQPVVDFLQATASTILYVGKYAPTVDAELSREDVYKLARLAEVESISLPPEEVEPCMVTASRTINADDVWWGEGYDGGYNYGSGSPTGTQTKVAVVDDGIDFTHPYLDHANGGTRPGTTIRGEHGTEVAGCIASDHSAYTGIAPGTEILDANCANVLNWYVYWKDACEWAHENNADIYNFSAGDSTGGGCDNDICKFFDHIAYVWGRLPVCSAGNDASYVTSPANAWNVLAVGGIDDHNTVSWTDDTLYQDSNYVNPNSPKRPGDYYLPLVNDREKPEVCAPAVDITTTVPGGGFTDDDATGTSAAAPQVSGIAALLIERNPTLRDKPALLKAIIMASAIHNVVGDPRKDDKEGVGTVDAYAAYQCVNNNWIWDGYKAEANLPFEIYFSAQAGQKVRFVIAWYAHTNYDGTSYYGNGLCADLGLEIKGPYMSSLGLSNSVDSAWEIVQFTAPWTATYRARVTAYNHGYGDPWTYDGAEYIAAAWYRW
jgi:subtilisin family serine protease